jgi:hypothetical protein
MIMWYVITCKAWRLEELDQVTQLDQPSRIDLHHGETRDQIVRQLVVT